MSGTAAKPEKSAQELVGWKDIAGYMDRSVRTVQNWKLKHGLPVYTGAAPRSVYALANELDEWKRTRYPLTAAKGLQPSKLQWAGVVVAITLGAGALIYAVRPAQSPAFYRFENNKLIVLDQESRELWTLHFPADFAKNNPDPETNAQAAIADLDNDGSPEVIVLPHLVQQMARTLHCYAKDGKRLWQYSEARTVRTARESYSPRYKLKSFIVLDPDVAGKRRVAVTAIHELYWPSAVTLLNDDGETIRQYWHGGHLGMMATDGSRLYVGGTRNYTGRAALVVLDIEAMSGTSEEDEAHQLLDLGPERVETRLTFARSCLGQRAASLGKLLQVDVNADEIVAHTLEQVEAPRASLTWAFTKDLAFKSVTESSLYTKEKASADPACLASEKLEPQVVAER